MTPGTKVRTKVKLAFHSGYTIALGAEGVVLARHPLLPYPVEVELASNPSATFNFRSDELETIE